jgi:hypothetical protein
VLVITIIITYIQGVILSNCPLLRSITDNSGFLFVNKTVMMYTEIPVHCQWLIASSPHQVIKFSFMIIFKIKFSFDSIENYS